MFPDMNILLHLDEWNTLFETVTNAVRILRKYICETYKVIRRKQSRRNEIGITTIHSLVIKIIFSHAGYKVTCKRYLVRVKELFL